MRKCVLLLGIFMACIACGSSVGQKPETVKNQNGKKDEDTMNSQGSTGRISREIREATVSMIRDKFPNTPKGRIEIGAGQVADRWTAEDGSEDEYKSFCVQNFTNEPEALETMFLRIQDNLEQVNGHFLEASRFLREPTDLESGAILPVDHMFAAMDLNAHFLEDLYKSKVAFFVLLNYRIYSLAEKLELGKKWSRLDWAYARLADLVQARVPPHVKQEITESEVAAGTYITEYNIYMHHLLTPDRKRLFPAGLKLISHWGLRDELKAQYAAKDGLERQRMIEKVMEKIISQEIPSVVINNPKVDWVVDTGEVVATDVKDAKSSKTGAETDRAPSKNREPDTRYEMLRRVFKAKKMADAYYPKAPTYVQRKFELGREIPEDEVVALLKAVLSAPVIKDTAELIKRRLGRPLEPFDLWYDGFSSRGNVKESKLDAIVQKKYPSAEAFQADLPKILGRLGFDKKTGDFLGTKIKVDRARGSGHAWGAARREDNAHLRTRITENGLNYKGYNIAIHELGHNVEQVLTLNRIDHHLLNGVPNTAFTEGFAFAFQGNDLKLLGMEAKDSKLYHLKTLDTIWSTFEISGVALVDIGIWKWMYDNPDATAEEIRQGIIKIARNVWNQYFAPVLGKKDQTLLAVYSHIIDGGMYVPDYPLGFLIQFQMDEYFRKNGLAGEMVRMCKSGSITPEAWMENAVGGPISAEPMIRAAGKAVVALDSKGRDTK